jgi:hypothetical protein
MKKRGAKIAIGIISSVLILSHLAFGDLLHDCESVDGQYQETCNARWQGDTKVCGGTCYRDIALGEGQVCGRCYPDILSCTPLPPAQQYTATGTAQKGTCPQTPTASGACPCDYSGEIRLPVTLTCSC